MSATVTPGPNTTLGSTTTSRPSLVSAQRNTVSGAISVAPSSIARRRSRSCISRFGGGQLGAGVDPQELLGRQFGDPARQALRAGDRDDVGQVELALGVVVPDSVHQVEGVARIDRHDAAVAQPDRPLFGAGVLGLDDAQQGAVRPEHEAAIGSGIGRPHAGDRDRDFGRAAPRIEQRGDGLGAQQRGVAEQHDNVGDAALSQAIAASAGRAARTASPVPRGGDWMTLGAGATARATESMSRPTHDDGLGRIERAQRVDDVADHRRPGDLVQHLGARRFEAGALAGGEDDGGETGSAHDTARPKAHGERNAIIG